MFLDSCKTFLTYLGAWLSSTPLYAQLDSSLATPQFSLGHKPGPVFDAPNGPDIDTFQCDYSSLKGYRFCSSEDDRSCWLKGPNKKYDIDTDYENDYPDSGVTREVMSPYPVISVLRLLMIGSTPSWSAT